MTLAGSIHKSRWQTAGPRDNLEIALGSHQRGAASGVRSENGYAAISAAFALDLLGKL